MGFINYVVVKIKHVRIIINFKKNINLMCLVIKSFQLLIFPTLIRSKTLIRFSTLYILKTWRKKTEFMYLFSYYILYSWNGRLHHHWRIGHCNQIIGSKSYRGRIEKHDQWSGCWWQWNHRIWGVLESHGKENEG